MDVEPEPHFHGAANQHCVPRQPRIEIGRHVRALPLHWSRRPADSAKRRDLICGKVPVPDVIRQHTSVMAPCASALYACTRPLCYFLPCC